MVKEQKSFVPIDPSGTRRWIRPLVVVPRSLSLGRVGNGEGDSDLAPSGGTEVPGRQEDKHNA